MQWIATGTLALFFIGLTGCQSRGTSSETHQDDPLWPQYLTFRKGIPPEDGSPLQLVSSTPMLPIDETEGLAADNRGQFYMLSNANHHVNRVLSGGQTPEPLTLDTAGSQPLQYPNALTSSAGRIYVADVAGVRVLQGSKQVGLISSFFTVSSMFAEADGSLFVMPLITQPVPFRPVVLHVSPEGRKLRQYGEASASGPYFSIRDEGFVAADAEKIYVAFKHRPTLAIFDRVTGARQEYAIHHPSFARRQAYDSDQAFTSPGKGLRRLSSYTAGIAIGPGGVYVVLDTPSLNLRQYDREGTLQKTYTWTPPKPILQYNGVVTDPADTRRISLNVVYDSAGDEGKAQIVTLNGLIP